MLMLTQNRILKINLKKDLILLKRHAIIGICVKKKAEQEV